MDSPYPVLFQITTHSRGGDAFAAPRFRDLCSTRHDNQLAYMRTAGPSQGCAKRCSAMAAGKLENRSMRRFASAWRRNARKAAVASSSK